MANPAIRYSVHGVNATTVERTVKLDGAEIPASVPALVVELVNDGHGHSFTFVGAEAEAAAALFTPGANITATFKKDA